MPPSYARRSQDYSLIVLAGLALVVLAAMMWRVAENAPQLDEYATMWFSDPAVPLAQLYTQRWAGETNPPLYYIAVLFLRRVADPGIELLRLSHALPFALTSCYLLLFASREPAHRAYAATLAALYVTSGTTMQFFPELRSYFLQFTAMTAVCAALTILRSPGGWSRWMHWLVLAVAMPMLLNLHFTAALLAGLIALAAIGEALNRSDRRVAVWLFVLCVFGVAPALAFILANFTALAGRARDFWITTTPREALWYIWLEVRGAPSRNVVLLLAVPAGVLSFGRRWPAALAKQRAYGSVAVSQALAVGAFFAVVFVANVAKPILITKYLLVAGAPMMSVLACLAAPALERWWWAMPAVLANAALAVSPLAWHPMVRPVQAQSDRATVARLAAACPGTVVYGLWQKAESNGVYELMYRTDAALLGLNLRPRLADSAWTPALDPHCPTILWATHALDRQTAHDAAGFAKLFSLSLPADVLAAAKLTITQEVGLILVLPPRP